MLISTPTGSTAYAFPRAPGPVAELDAILWCPTTPTPSSIGRWSSPRSTVAVESNLQTSAAQAVLDGFRTIPMPAGSRIEITRGEQPVRWVRLDAAPFTDRLVHKFRLPVTGWRGPRR